MKSYVLLGMVLMTQSLSLEAGGAGGGSWAPEVVTQKHAPLLPCSAAASSLVVNGQYEHYSGKRYQVLVLARHTETLEELVCYKALYDGEMWVRPAAMFTEEVCVNGQVLPRFRFVG